MPTDTWYYESPHEIEQPSTTGSDLPPPVIPPSPAKIFSQESGLAPFETLFHDLNLIATPVYNFWEYSEETSTPDRGNQKIDDLPRYIRLDWDPAPVIKLPSDIKKKQLESKAPDARDVFTQLSPFGFGSHAVVGTTNNGLNWTPPHLQPENFTQVANSLANGYVFAGILEAVVEVQTSSLAPPPQFDSSLVDEDQYLSHPELTSGIPYSEYTVALWNWKSRLMGAQARLMNQPLSNAAAAQNSSLVMGQFSVSVDSEDVQVKAVNSLSPPISFTGESIDDLGKAQVSRVIELADQLGTGYIDDVANEYQRAKIKMIHTNLEGLYDQTRIDNMTQPQHAESVSAMAPFIGNMAVYSAAGMQSVSREISLPSFNTPESVKQLEYIGYIIEKYEQVDGSFKRVDIFYIPGNEYTQYFDSKVKYGVAYRYRIRSVIRWTRPHGTGIFGPDPTVRDAPGAGLNSLAPNDASYFGSEWCGRWAAAILIDTVPPPPPDELIVRPHSEPDPDLGVPYVEIAFKLPYNPQADINKMTLWRKLQDEKGRDVTDWVQLQEFTAVERQGTRYLYATDYEHQQDDITGTKFNARETESVETFVEFAPLNARFKDISVAYFGGGTRYRYVYAAICHTRHNETSVLSDQLGVRLNPNWEREGEYLTDFVSCAGVNKDFDVGLFGTWPERRLRSEVIFQTKISHPSDVPGKITFSGQSRIAHTAINNSNYIARIESLDTGEHIDVPVHITVSNQPTQNTVAERTVVVRSQ
jgi:hypothetical protein